MPEAEVRDERERGRAMEPGGDAAEPEANGMTLVLGGPARS
jgi:hypothetical protein